MKNKLQIILPFLIIFFLLGCELNNTPTSKVEAFLSNYQLLDNSIYLDDKINLFTNNKNLTDDITNGYKKIIERQYSALSYDVKDETIDGDNAVVEVQIEVFDYVNTLGSRIDDLSDVEKINLLEKANIRSNYTIMFNVNKNNNGDWELLPIGSSDDLKLLGLY